MAEDNPINPITKTTLIEALNEYGENVLFPKVEEIVEDKISNLRKDLPQIVNNAVKPVVTDDVTKLREENRKWKSEVLKSNDKVIKELKPFKEEQQAINQNYKTLDKRLDKVETFAEESAERMGVGFKKG